MKKSVLILAAILVLGACQRNKLKTDENSLTKQILTEEEQLAYEDQQRKAREKLLADSLAKLPRGFQFPEERGVDPDRPPLIIDIANSLDNIADLSLSDVASSIEYIRMEPVPDSTMLTNMKYKYYLMDNNIVATNLYGVHIFTKNGRYIRTIVKNEISGVSYDEKNDRVMILWSNYMKIGASAIVWARNNTLFYNYFNTNTGQCYIMEYDCSDHESIETPQFNPEQPNQIMGAGKISIDLTYGHPKPPVIKQQGAMSMNSQGYYTKMNVFAPDRNITINILKGKNMMDIVNARGDLLASFTKYERVENYTKSIGRGTDGGNRYEKNGNLFYRTDFNDTIFQFIPPNQLLPVYVYNLGDYKLTMLQGMDPGFDLAGKIIPMDFADTKNFLFLTFTKDSYDCPNTRRDKSLKLYRALFNKKTRHLSILTADPSDYYAPILKNDIDGGVPVWPDEIMIGKNGEIMVSLRGKELKNHVASDSYTNSTAPTANKEKLKQVAMQANDDDQILMIVK
jgi:hypothetical protein